MAVTIREVAEAAGVSVATVSRALNGKTVISQRTRDHVAAIAAELGYEMPFRSANGSQERKVAVVLPFIGRWYFARIIEGIERITREHNFDTIILRPFDSTGQPVSVANHLDHFGATGVIIVSHAPTEEELSLFISRKLPAVLIDINEPRFTAVGIDDFMVGKIATEYLLSLGHRKIAIVTGDPNDPLNFTTPRDRLAGYRAALKSAGIEAPPEFEIHADFTARGAAAAVEQLFSRHDVPTAVFAASDEMAFGVIGAANRLGLRVPQDLSVIGVDDHDISESIGLTTVAQPIDTIAELAAWQLVARMTHSADTPPQKFVMPVTLVVRNSTAAISEGS